jgi:Metal-dependent hydrolases of the beta-lactamase superfamily III
MVDCGEGTQMQLRRSHIRFTKLSAVFITHLHGDHCFGLIGMISTFGLLGRTAKLTVYAPAELEPMLQEQMRMFCRGLEFEVVFQAIDTTRQQVIYEDHSLTVETIPLEHRMPCCGFLFKEKTYPAAYQA